MIIVFTLFCDSNVFEDENAVGNHIMLHCYKNFPCEIEMNKVCSELEWNNGDIKRLKGYSRQISGNQFNPYWTQRMSVCLPRSVFLDLGQTEKETGTTTGKNLKTKNSELEFTVEFTSITLLSNYLLDKNSSFLKGSEYTITAIM